jgi:hypothetical protein
VHTQAGALLLRIERLPLSMNIPPMVYLRLAYPCPASTVAHSIGLDTADQRRSLTDFLANEPFALEPPALGRQPPVKMPRKSKPIGSEGATVGKEP